MGSDENARPGRARWPLRIATAVLSPLLFLGTFEAALWIAGFGDPLPLFVAVPERPAMRRANPEVMRRYFPRRAPRVSPEAIEFAAEKPDGTLRLVVQGGSTAAGFPYGRFAGLAGMLGERLEAAAPDRGIEVISTAMAAVNSYTLLDFVDEILAVEPDAVLLYAGHNEYMGVFGVGSGLTQTRSRAATRAHLRLRRFRTYQYLQALVALARDGLRGRGAEAPDAAPAPLIARAAAGREVPYGSEIWREGVEQFRANLGAILARYQEAGVPVLVGTLVSNLKDRPPFASADGPEGAAAWFARGRHALIRGDPDGALRAFREARDRDRLPFRAPTAFDAVVREQAKRFGASVVEVDARFRDASPDGIVGRELLLEHVHPNAEGYFLLADAFLEALRRHPTLAPSIPPDPRSDADARREMPITALDRVLAGYAVREIEAAFPFTRTPRAVVLPPPEGPLETLAWQRHHEEISWLEAMEGLMQHFRKTGRPRDAAVVARMAAEVFPEEPAIDYTTGMLYPLELDRLPRARRYLERSLRIDPGDRNAQRALASVRARLGR